MTSCLIAASLSLCFLHRVRLLFLLLLLQLNSLSYTMSVNKFLLDAKTCSLSLCFLASKRYKWYVLISRRKSFRFCCTKRINAGHSEEASAGVLWAMMLSFIHWLPTEVRRRSNYSRRLPPSLPCVARREKGECPHHQLSTCQFPFTQRGVTS